MKKTLGFVLAFILIASMLCVTALAAGAPASGVVLRVSAEKNNETTVVVADYKNFAEGWKAAIGLAKDESRMKKNDYDRVIVDIYADWKAVKGEFVDNGDGTSYVLFPEKVKVTLNLNGHTVNRGLAEYQYNGEVMYIAENADVIINNGTVTGGWSRNSAGGIHIDDDAKVTLNNVNVVGNTVEKDNGAAVAVHDGAVLTMKGGSISNNKSIGGKNSIVCGGGIYAEESKVYLDGVTFENNQGYKYHTRGAALLADDSLVVMNNCKVIGNGTQDAKQGAKGAQSIIEALPGSNVTVKNTSFSKNGFAQQISADASSEPSSLLSLNGSKVTIESCSFTENKQVFLIDDHQTELNVLDTDFAGNDSLAYKGIGDGGAERVFENCIFSRGVATSDYANTFFLDDKMNNTLTFVDCRFGNSTFNDKSAAKFENTKKLMAASIFGEGSLVMLVGFVALIVASAIIVINVTSNKNKKSTSAANASKIED